MSEQEGAGGPAIGSMVGLDLTVSNADEVRDFYAAVIGWTVTPVDMGEYSDYMMEQPGTGIPGGGICNLRGINAEQVSSQWIPYIQVANLTASVAKSLELGGSIVNDRRAPGNEWPFVVIKDPSGAVIALMGPE
ncbi:MAG: VOC family protein [Thermomicrobiales bacterium]